MIQEKILIYPLFKTITKMSANGDLRMEEPEKNSIFL